MDLRLCYLTAGSVDEAMHIARTLVAEKLAACANVVGGMTAVYEWQGDVHEHAEAILLVKTRAELLPPLIERVEALHSYDCPCVVSLPIDGGNPAFLDWISSQTTPAE